MVYSTISVSPDVKRRLNRFRIYRRETYDELLSRLMENAGMGDEEGEYAEETKERLKRGLAEIRTGETISVEQVIKKHQAAK